MSPRDPDRLVERKTAEDAELRATVEMCLHCFDILLLELQKSKHSSINSSDHYYNTLKREIAVPDFINQLPDESIQCPLFVTWDKKQLQRHHHRRHHHHHSSGNGSHDKSSSSASNEDQTHFELRGCIGTLSPKPLASSVGQYALLSALNDRRFHPVELQEIPQLRVAVSLLVNYEPCEHVHDWVVGVHGIMIQWRCREQLQNLSATYLPEVALEQGWDQETAIQSLIRKAGYHGPVTDDLLKRIQCTRYQSSKLRVTYDEYVQQRGGHDPVRQELELRESSSSSSTPGNCSIM